MNRAQLEHREVDRELAHWCAPLRIVEILVGETPAALRGTLRHCHGWDDIGTYMYCRSKLVKGARYKRYKLFPHDLYVQVVDHGVAR